MIGHRTLLRENEDLPLWGAPAFMKKRPCCYVRALITLEQGRKEGRKRCQVLLSCSQWLH